MPVSRAKPAAPTDDKRWRIVETRMRRLGNRRDALVEALHSAQEAFGYIDDDALRYVSDSLAVPPSTVFGVATFYHYFTLKPQGEHTCVVCTGTACYINGAIADPLGDRDPPRREAEGHHRPTVGCRSSPRAASARAASRRRSSSTAR